MKQNNLKDSTILDEQKKTLSGLAFGKGNFKIMIIGVAIIITGFIIMTLDKEEFGFGFMGITLGPILAFLGFMIQFYAILKKKS